MSFLYEQEAGSSTLEQISDPEIMNFRRTRGKLKKSKEYGGLEGELQDIEKSNHNSEYRGLEGEPQDIEELNRKLEECDWLEVEQDDIPIFSDCNLSAKRKRRKKSSHIPVDLQTVTIHTKHNVVSAISFIYISSNAIKSRIPVGPWGGKGGTEHKISLKHGEQLRQLSGTVVDYDGSTVIQSLTLKSDDKTYGPYGGRGGQPFKILTQNGKIVSFFGRSGDLLISLGAYIYSK